MSTVAFIGLGTMGFPMAGHLARAGHDVRVFNRTTSVAERWLGLLPPDQRGKLEPPEFFHEVLVHRWYLSERAGHEVDIFDAAADYIARVLPQRPDELVAAD